MAFSVSHLTSRRLRHTDPMEPAFSVQADTPEQCAALLRDLCDALGLATTLPPTRSLGTGRWMARAMPKAPAGDGRGSGVR